MATGFHAHRARREAASALGKELTRRSKSHCELCRASGERLEVVEVPPLPDTPDANRAMLLCESCGEGLLGGRLEPGQWRFLEEAVWSDVPPVQVAAVRMARRLQAKGTGWAQELLAGLYLDPEIEAWVDEGA